MVMLCPGIMHRFGVSARRRHIEHHRTSAARCDCRDGGNHRLMLRGEAVGGGEGRVADEASEPRRASYLRAALIARIYECLPLRAGDLAFQRARREVDRSGFHTITEAPDPYALPTVRLELLIIIGNVAWKRARKGEISAEHARAAAQALSQFLSLTVPTVGLLSPALGIALTFEHPIYDCMYLALAEQRKAQIVTADTLLFERLAGTGWTGPTVSLAEITP